MENSRNLQLAIRLALATAGVAGGVPVALSQTVAATTPAPALEEVVVTGSRLSTPNETSISPITSVSASTIESTGLTRVEDVLNNLPMVFAGENATSSNGGDGTSTIDLRGLGPQRTLVLVNGRRLGPGIGDGRNYSDLNQIPAALIQRVDILTGGASSVYGADAVAGVVNFILDTHFEGVKVDTGYNFFQHHQHSPFAPLVSAAGDAVPDSSVDTGFGKTVSVIMGSNFADNRGNATAYATYDNSAAVLQGKYDHSACTLNPKGTGVACGGSIISKGGYFSAYGNSGTSLFVNTVDQNNGAFRPFADTDRYNYGPVNFYQVPQTRWTAGTFVNYDINSHVNAYMEVMATRTTVETQVAAGGDFGEVGAHFIPCGNPLLNATEAAAICSPANQLAQGNPSETVNGVNYPGLNVYTFRRNVEGGGRQQTFGNNAIRTLVGVKGDFAEAWKFDVYAQHSSVDGTSSQGNYLSNLLLPNAVNVITGPALLSDGATANPLAGQPECVVTYTGADKACVPWNIWKPGGVTQAALKYLSVPLLINYTTTEELADASVTGDLGKYGVKLPWADSGLQVNIGAEYRSETANFSPDLEEQLGAAAGAGGPTPPISGGFHVGEGFLEARMPLADHLPAAESLALEGGYRYSAYSLGFNTNTYKFGVEWAPIHDVLLRSSYQRAVRAPNIGELYSPQAIGLDFTADPCAGPAVGATAVPGTGTINGFTYAQCHATGVSLGQFGNINTNPSNQYNGLLGGNTSLQPEISTTKSVGIVFKPHVLPNFSASVDYFQIGIAGDIATVGGGIILQQCLTGGGSLYCDLIHRNATGSLWNSQSGYVTDTTINVGSSSTKGFDVKTNYRQPLDRFGSLSFALEGTRTLQLITQPLTGGPTYDCVGYEGQTCGAGQPKWRHVMNTTWSTPWSGLEFVARWRFISAVKSDTSSPNPILNKGLPVPPFSDIPTYSYLDLSASVSFMKMFKLTLGANNILDKDPPLITGSDCAAVSGTPGVACNGNTWPGSYDSLGRYLYAHLSAQF